ncbi:MAG: phosphosulfolactate synthase [Bacteroidetes bacterium]|nr:phosphosulfolactate synthase [Bacteroidota bacterium]MBU1719913.1 phosphosulfolactate synthase [Bacteroidota bacterium]
MNVSIPYLPERSKKPRETGLTMVMDKGLSLRETEDMLSVSSEIFDLAKLGFGTALVTPNVEEKIKLYKSAGIRTYLGGTLFEAFIARGLFDEYRKLVSRFKLDMVEVSDGCIKMKPEDKCEYIRKLAKDFTVLSEVGSKEAGTLISPNKWVRMMRDELDAGSWKVIAEARESGTVGIYRQNGNAHVSLINKILSKVRMDDILWEAPIKAQAVWFIKLLGANVNLGNIAPNEVVSTETLRLGLRGDTFLNFLPDELQEKFRQDSPAKKQIAKTAD